MTDSLTSSNDAGLGNEGVKDETKPVDVSGQVKLWQERISLAKRELESWAKQSGADRFTQEYANKFELFFNGLKGNIPVPPTGEIFSYVQSDVANTYNREPYITVNAKAGGTSLGASLWEVILNYYWRHLKSRDEVELEIIDKDLVGDGWHKVGWECETSGPAEDLKIIHEGLYSCRVDWKDIVYNFGSKKVPYDCVWMAQRIVKPLFAVKSKYPNAKELKGSQNPEVEKSAYNSATYKDDISVAILWEVWNKEDRQIYLMAEGLNDKWLADPRPWPDYVDEFPFLDYWDFYVPNSPRHMSAIAPWESQVHENMVLLAAAVNHHKRWNRQMLVKKGAISGGDLDKIERGNDGAIIDYTGTGKLDETLKILDWGTMPADYYQLMDRVNALKNTVSGLPEFAQGGVTKTSTRTEGELQMMSQGMKGRSDRRVDRFEQHVEEIARHMMKHLEANFDFENVVRITGAPPEAVIQALGKHFDPKTQSVTFTTQDIIGDYEVDVKAGSTLPLNQETKISVMKELLGMILPAGQALGSPTVQALITDLLKVYDIKDLEDAFNQEKQQVAQQQQSEAQQSETESQKAKSQAGKNAAQADKVGAEADKIHLENSVVETALKTGTHPGLEAPAAPGAAPGGM